MISPRAFVRTVFLQPVVQGLQADAEDVGGALLHAAIQMRRPALQHALDVCAGVR